MTQLAGSRLWQQIRIDDRNMTIKNILTAMSQLRFI